MNIKLQKRLFRKYPKLFKQKDLSMDKTCMCWGLKTGDGWYFLIDSLCAAIQHRIKYHNVRQIEFTQVKEKFGGLRIYHDSCDDGIESMIEFACALSNNICEQCGSTQKVKQTRGWIRTLCKDCLKKLKEEKF